jgi:glyoxylase-like metal-dependent hydrolase (beta-lactamase superfamily II)
MESPRRLSSDSLSRRDALRTLTLGGVALAFAPLLGTRARAAAATVPSLAGKQPAFYRFHIGDIEAVALNDGDIGGSLKEMAWWAGASEAKTAATLQSAFLPENIVRLAVTVLLLRCGNELVLIDSGCGNLFGPIGGRLVQSLSGIGIKPEQITTVVVSHLHADHFGGLLDTAKAPTFPNARLILNKAEQDFWLQPNPDLSGIAMPAEAKQQAVDNAHAYLETLKDRWHLVGSGAKPVPGLELVDAPGHTPGHVAVMISSGEERLLHVADAVHHHAISFDHPEWHFVGDVLPDLAEKTRRALLARASAERLRIYGGHLPFPGIGHVRKGGGHFEYLIEAWSPA